MRKIREVLRPKHAHQTSERQISFAVGLSRSTIGDYLRRAAQARLSWPIPEAIGDAALERLLFPPRWEAPESDGKPKRREMVAPDFIET